MALHRNIFWVGRQWAVTGHGMQLIDQKLKGYFDIEVGRLWDESLRETMLERAWLNRGDFDKALSVARARYPEAPGQASAPRAPAVLPPRQFAPLPPPPAEPVRETVLPKPSVQPVLDRVVAEPPQRAAAPQPNISPPEPSVAPPPLAPPVPPSPIAEPVPQAVPPAQRVQRILDSILAEPPIPPAVKPPPKPELPTRAIQVFHMQFLGWPAKFVPPWHVRIGR